MKIFSYREYLIEVSIIPVISSIIGIFLVLCALLGFCRIYHKVNEGRIRKSSAYLIALILPIILICGAIVITSNAEILKYGLPLLGERETDAVEIVGNVDAISRLSLSIDGGSQKDGTAEITIDGIKYFIMSVKDLHLADSLRFQYLPKSKVILSYQVIPFEEYVSTINDIEVPNTSNNSFYVFSILLIILAFLTLMRLGSFDKKQKLKMQIDDVQWNRNEIRFHSSYQHQAVVFSVMLSIVGISYAIILCEVTILILLIIAITGISTFAYSRYKYWKLVYSEKEIILFSEFRKKEVIPIYDIISVRETVENPILAKGQIYRIVKIHYRTSANEKNKINMIKLDFRCHIGITRFEKFYESITRRLR